MFSEALGEFFRHNWGNLASVAGLLVSIATLLVAKGARKAAEDARAESLKRSLAEELQDALRKAEQMVLFLNSRKWEIVLLRAQEVAGACGIVLERWSDDLSSEASERILKAQVKAESVASAAQRAVSSEPAEAQFSRMGTAARQVHRAIAAEVGRSVGRIERSR